MKWFLYILVLLLPVNSLATDFVELEETDVTRAKTFVKEYPLVTNELDELGLVDLWQRIEGLHNLISVWDTNQAAFSQSGPDELRIWLWQIRKRIWSHLIYAKYIGDDEQVKALVAMIRLHATFAERYLAEEIRFSSYAVVAEYAESNGRYLAEQIVKKYGKGAKAQISRAN
jgi:hypothetical protein